MPRLWPLLSLILILALNGDARERAAVPADIVEALLGLHGTDTELLLGAVPDRLQSLVRLPVTARVDATMRRGTSHTIVITIPGAPAAARQTLIETLEAGGWEGALAPAPSRGGFHSSSRRPESLCKEDRRLSLITGPQRTGETRVSLQLQTLPEGQTCRGGQESFNAHVPMPDLEPPRRTTLLGTSGGGGRDYRQSTVDFETELSLDELLEHFDEQILEQGWSRRSKLGDQAAGLLVYERPGDEGEEWIGLLTGTAVGDGTHHMSMRVFERKK